jgi:hypothetical protein
MMDPIPLEITDELTGRVYRGTLTETEAGPGRVEGRLQIEPIDDATTAAELEQLGQRVVQALCEAGLTSDGYLICEAPDPPATGEDD